MVSIHEKDDFSVNDTGGSEKKKTQKNQKKPSTPNTRRSQTYHLWQGDH